MELSGPITFPGDSGNTYDPSVAGSGQKLAGPDDISLQKPPYIMSFQEFVKKKKSKKKK